mmetsp:Transcript_27421/g.40494  ORF Transcript_27421/g.40494 Transcript_27421/m.40494 type:complete len:643 (+) Transcript_27421:231-2159(+)|eukprot:CAMPEP_0194214996 /NCGR_PEP_ID=MMETSP0156-20130528/16469_1 /TAXON_ID=33649 /ORGANISM="Thalassionema nitzschioides, Strain L26-B" /LENGTH=642 /DNA_ID=CAMNT_0038943393 /DNA_START=172 /DNA_END=2100 /DNA_ORIENTATION=+
MKFYIALVVVVTSNILFGGVEAAVRNPKKGIAIAGAQACSTLEPHTDSSWWYSWTTTTGFDGKKNFCDAGAEAVHPVDAARADGMEFVPMFWSSVPSTLTEDEIANFQAATHVIGFNEPERTDQANLTPAQAATMWADVVAIANEYNLQIVGPCVTKDAYDWYDQWLTACDSLYGAGVGCQHDKVCIHMYLQPHPCNTSKSWECVGDETGYHAKYYLNKWYDDYGNKPIWVTEYGCYPWIAGGCDASKHSVIMDQLTSIYESDEFSNKLERYNWFTTYASDPLAFGSGALNVPNWEFVGEGVGCPSREWVANAYPTFSWGIKEIHECVDFARANIACASPLVLSMDNDNCYCSTDYCINVENTYGGMMTYRELSLQAPDASSLSASGEQYNNFGLSTPSPVSPAPTPPPVLPCANYGQDPFYQADGTCCTGLTSCLDDHYSTGNWHYRCYLCCSDPHDAPCPTPVPTADPTPAPTPEPTLVPIPAPVAGPTPLCGTNPASVPNNGICEDGENCLNSPNDCAGNTGGKPTDRFCCYGGIFTDAVQDATICTNSVCGPVEDCSVLLEGQWCCGDGICAGGGETIENCPEDCGGVAPVAPPVVAPVAPPTPSSCSGGGIACAENNECCSNKCDNKGRNPSNACNP